MLDLVPKDSDFYHNLVYHKRANQPYSLITGGRGVGKTFQIKKEVIAAAAKNQEFFYMRRTDKEINAGAFSDWAGDLARLSGKPINIILNGHEIILKEGESGKRIGWAYSLTQSHMVRGYNYDNVKFCLYDEFLPELTRYRRFYAGELTDFKSIVMSVFRFRQAKVYMLSNLVSTVNPYYSSFKLININWPGITKSREGMLEIIPPLPINEYYARNVNHVRDSYDEDYKMYLAGQGQLEARKRLEKAGVPRNARYIGCIGLHGEELGFFLGYNGEAIYIGKADPSDKRRFVIDSTDIAANTYLIKHSNDSYMFKLLSNYYRAGKIVSKSVERELIFCEIAERLHFY